MAWAAFVTPFIWAGFALFAVVILAVFLIIISIHGLDADARLGAVQQWAGVVYPSVVGVISAVVGYLFGTRASEAPTTKDDLGDR
jgi:hypothetical protein